MPSYSLRPQKDNQLNISRKALLAALPFAAALAAPAHAQGFLGQPLQVSANSGSNPSSVIINGGTQTIAAAGNTYTLTGLNLSVFVTPTQITYTNTLSGADIFTGGVILVDKETGLFPATITGVSIDPSTTATGLNPATVTFDATDIFVPLTARFNSGGAKIVLDYTTAAPVPEASTTVSLGLLLALGMGGLVIAKKRKKAMAS